MKILLFAVLLAAFIGCASSNKKESSGEYFDNSVITAKVKAAIFDESSLKTLEINVETFKGKVQLSGFVDSKQNAELAGRIASQVEGVTSVQNSLALK
ncbi:BON domain-containing protein [Geovibrio thiophilus]|nr:BON domain-containing protein [Geovibrio thiophilus]